MEKRNISITGGFGLTHRRFSKPPQELYVRHCHEDYEILYVLDGNGKSIVEGIEYPMRPGTLMIFSPFEYHCLMMEPDMPYERYVLFFNVSDLSPDIREMIENADGENGIKSCFYSADSISPSLISIFERFENSTILPEKERRTYAKLLVSEIVLLLSVVKKERIPYNEIELGARVIRYLNDHIDKDITLDKLAKKFFVSKYYLCRAFKKHNGISVHGYINQKRVMYAKSLIESGETASGAAYKVGFGDYSAFYRAYVKIVGKAPTYQGEAEKTDEL